MDELVSLVNAVLDARLGVPDVEARLITILEALPPLSDNAALRAELSLFVDTLISEYVIPDRLPLRSAALARIAWRTIRVVNPARAARIGLFETFNLLGIDAHSEALELVELVEADARVNDDPMLRALISIHVLCLSKLQRFEEAHQVAQGYEESVLIPSEDLIELHMLVRSARAAASAGHLEVAMARARRAVELFEIRPGPEDDFLEPIFPALEAAGVYMVLGDVLRRSLDHLGAIDVYQQGRTKSLEAGQRLGAAWCLSEIAITWEHLSEFQRGQELLQQAAWEAEQAGDTTAAARWRGQHVRGADGAVDMRGSNGLSAIYRMFQTQGPTEEIERLTRDIIKAERGTGTTIEPTARNLLANIYAAGKKYELALSAVAAAIAIADKLQEKWLALSFRCHQARILFNMGSWVAANELCDRIFKDADGFLDDARTSEIRQAFMSAIALATEIALVTASVDGRHESGAVQPRNPQRVLSIVDRTQGRTFNRWLGLMEWSLTSGSIDLPMATRELIAADVVVEWTASAARAVSGPLEARRLAAENLARVAAAANANLPELHADGTFPDLTQGLRAGTVILGLTAVESGIVCLCFESGKAPRTEHIYWGRKNRTSWFQRLRAAQLSEARRIGVLATDDVSGAEETEYIEKVYEELREVLVDPLIGWLGRDWDHLVVAQHAELASIPLWALARALPDVALSVVPTLRSVVLLTTRPAPSGQVRIAMGDATGSLRMASREIELLRAYTNVTPSVEELQRAALSASRIHFAGHGEFDADNPYSSGLILRGVNQSPYAIASSYAGCVRLTIAGIFKSLHVKECELITISACSVGAPRAHAASEFTSVPTAFLLVGARNVLAAGWSVHDAATAVLMSHFYASLDSETNIATALACARRKLAVTTREQASAILGRIDALPSGDPPFASPIFTDAFMHFGVGFSPVQVSSAD